MIQKMFPIFMFKLKVVFNPKGRLLWFGFLIQAIKNVIPLIIHMDALTKAKSIGTKLKLKSYSKKT